MTETYQRKVGHELCLPPSFIPSDWYQRIHKFSKTIESEITALLAILCGFILVLHPFQEHSDEIKQRGLSRLATLLEHADPVELFVATVTSVMFTTPEKLTQANSDTASIKIERLAYELYPHFGKSRASSERESVESTTLRTGDIQLCHEILDDLLFSHMFQAFRPAEEEDDLIASIRGRATIVRGNAYPPQTERRIRELQEKGSSLELVSYRLRGVY